MTVTETTKKPKRAVKRPAGLNSLKAFTGLTKAEITAKAAESVLNIIEAGNALEIAETLGAMETFIKEVRGQKLFIEEVRDEVSKYGKTYSAASGAKIELAETGTAYDFTKCEDTVLCDLENSFKEADKLLKARKEFLKTVPASGLGVIDEATGELMTIYPPPKSSTSSYKITLAK